MTSSDDTAQRKLEDELVYWQHQLATLKQFQRRLRWVVPVCAGAGLFVSILAHHMMWLLGGLVLGALTGAIGIYMYQVRSVELETHLAEAQQALERHTA